MPARTPTYHDACITVSVLNLELSGEDIAFTSAGIRRFSQGQIAPATGWDEFVRSKVDLFMGSFGSSRRS